MASKPCTKCGVEKDEEAFSRAKRGLLGRHSQCKACKSAYRKEWMTPEKESEYHRRDYEKHGEQRRAANTATRLANRDRHVAYATKWNRANLTRRREIARNYTQRRRARMYGCEVSFTETEWQERIAYFGGRCAYCLVECDRPTIDHIVPISKGGAHSVENTVPACMTCNVRKSDMSLLRFVAIRGV